MDQEDDFANHILSEIKDLTKQIEHGMLLTIAGVMSNYLKLVPAYSVNSKQLDIPTQAFMVNTGLFCIKPRIILFGDTKVKMEEYSSVSRNSVMIRRAETIVAGYTNYNGDRVVRDLYGIEARYFQHEVDNLNEFDWKTRGSPTAQLNAVKRTLH